MTKEEKKFIVIRVLSNAFIFGGIAIILVTYGPWIFGNAKVFLASKRGVTWELSENQNNTNSTSFIKSLLDKKPIALEPKNKDFSIVIPRIGLSVPVVEDVAVENREDYLNALKNGVAHAKGSVYPGESGNSYYFAHSSLDFWELGPYATSFNLLNRLWPGDIIFVYYKNQRYTFKILQTELVKGWDTAPYFRDFLRPMLTLQTCDPPGTTLNRFLVLAELVK